MTPPDAFATAARRSLADPGSLRARLAAVRTERSVRTLNDWVEDVRVRLDDGASVPWFDPAPGGVAARSLLRLEAPGRKAMGRKAQAGWAVRRERCAPGVRTLPALRPSPRVFASRPGARWKVLEVRRVAARLLSTA
ncbi:hypothetical protein [Streptomyces sp. NPDC047999]|uniref:hypothetical protein n=1 Tax=Streptomyces sp. NPDC047999 TaxID=3365497 RepID=UPI0037110696